MARFKCRACNYFSDKDETPDQCPGCGAPNERFAKLTDDMSNLVDKSSCSNQLHVGLTPVFDQAHSISETGMKDNLDPACTDMFIRARDEARLLSQFIKTALEVHAGMGKRG